jgi:RNA polymerase sigma factor (sigma-70 family)
MPTTEPTPEPRHPLLEDEGKLGVILDVMYAKIHKVLRWPNPGRQGGSGGGPALAGAGPRERAIVGTGVSADDILSEALADLLARSPEDVQVSWRALAVTIAEHKAVDALRRAGKGLRETPKRERLRLVSGDAPAPGRHDEEPPASILDLHQDPFANPEEEFHAINDVFELVKLARELLTERDQRVFLQIHARSKTRRELADELGLTRQRVGQIYDDALERLEADPRYPYGENTEEQKEGRDE